MKFKNAILLILLLLISAACNPFAQPTPLPFQPTIPAPVALPTQAGSAPTATLPPALPGMPTLPPQPQPLITLTPPAQPLPIGRWVISKFAFAAISAMDQTQANTWLGKSSDITPTSITFDGKACQITATGRSTSTASDYFLVGFKTNPATIGVTQDKLDVIKTNCTGTPFEQFGQLNATTIVIAWNGVFFFMSPPTQTTQPPAKRISFAPGAILSTVLGNLPVNTIDQYVLRVLANQRMQISVISAQAKMLLSVNGTDGQVLKSMGAGTANFDGLVPSTQDYFLTVSTENGAPASYTMQITIPPLTPLATPTPMPKRISFAAGATSAMVQSTLPTNGMERWIIRAQAGQTMTAKATSLNGNVMLIVFGVDGDVYQTDHVGSPEFSGQLRTTQDYYIDVRAWGDTAPTYTLQVTIPPLK